MAINFGTDGWRAVISDDFTFDNVRKVAQAIAEKTLADVAGAGNGSGTNGKSHRPSLVVGFDTRFLSDRYAIAVAEVLAANGIHVWLTHRRLAHAHDQLCHRRQARRRRRHDHGQPQPAALQRHQAQGRLRRLGQPGRLQGSGSGASSRPTTPSRSAWSIEAAVAQGLITRFDPFPAYDAHLRRLVDFDAIAGRNLSVAVDRHVRRRPDLPARACCDEAGCQVARDSATR